MTSIERAYCHPAKRRRTSRHERKASLAFAEESVERLLALEPAVYGVEHITFGHANLARAGRGRHRRAHPFDDSSTRACSRSMSGTCERSPRTSPCEASTGTERGGAATILAMSPSRSARRA